MRVMMDVPWEARVINRPDRPERWDDVQKELARVGVSIIERFPAFITTPGWEGCRDSHISLLEKAQYDELILVLEDDIIFLQDISLLDKAYEQLPMIWDCVYLGASPKEEQRPWSENLVQLNNAHTTHGILWWKRKYGAVDYILKHRQDIRKWDDYLAKVIQPNFGCFCVNPILATQRQYQSDTCGRSDVSTIVNNFNRFCI